MKNIIDMATAIQLNTNIKLNFRQIADLAQQLPKKEKEKLASILAEEEPIKTKADIINDIKEALEEVKLYKAGKIKLKTLDEFLDEF